MNDTPKTPSWRPPSLDALLRSPDGADLVATFGRQAATACLRDAIQAARENGGAENSALLGDTALRLAKRRALSIKPVFNLTGAVLHTNLGRAPLADSAITAMQQASGFVNLEYDLAKGRRGERDSHIAGWLTSLTGAEAGLVVNNNAAAVMAVLNTLSRGKEAIISRGELVEIGGAFRMPEVMARAGVKLREVGATNRTHLRDYEEAINEKTAMIVRVRPSNYAITGFTSSVPEKELAALAKANDVIFYDELGAGALVDFRQWGLPYERTVQEALGDGTDIVSFSGDKLLGGPQAGMIVGRADLVKRVAKNPLKRALRLDKATLAALAATLQLYDDPDTLAEKLPSIRLLALAVDAIRPTADRMAEALRPMAKDWIITVEDCASQIGSGALPVDMLPSAAVTMALPETITRGRGRRLERLAAAFRTLPRPVIGRIAEDRFWLDCRCLEDEAGFAGQLQELQVP
jgi:L-seryl-tRNA(Ser) seleniumtransferase